jgi:hypothetical protein
MKQRIAFSIFGTGALFCFAAVFAGEAAAQVYPRPIDPSPQGRAHRQLLHPRPVRPERVRPDMVIPPTPYPATPTPQSPGLLPYGFTMTRTWTAQASQVGSEARLDKPREVSDRLLACWRPPVMPVQQEVTIRLGFARDGRPIGIPRITYVGGALNESHREALRKSILKAISDCTPLRFTQGLASAIAGRPFAIRFIAPAQKPSGNSI